MNRWKKIKLDDVGEIVTGKTPETIDPTNYGSDYMFLGPTDLHKHFIISKSEKMISEKGLLSIKGSIIDGLSILVGCIGWDMGNVALVNVKCATNQQINSITKIKDEYNPYYIYYWFKQKKQYLFQIASVTRTPMLKKSFFSSIELNIPDKSQQDKVVSILVALDSKIELNNRINAQLEAMAKTLYDYWFVQFDFPDANGKPYKSSGGAMVWNEELKREIPHKEGWKLVSLGEEVNIFDSKRIPLSSIEREKRRGKYPYYGATCIMDYIDDYIFDGEYILLAEDGSVMDEWGNPIVQYIWGKTWVNNHAHILQPKEQQNIQYLFYLLKSISVVQIMTGSIQKKINQENLVNVKVVIPDNRTLEKFSKFASPIRKQMINIYEENQKLSELRDWLLPMLMNGQVKVK